MLSDILDQESDIIDHASDNNRIDQDSQTNRIDQSSPDRAINSSVPGLMYSLVSYLADQYTKSTASQKYINSYETEVTSSPDQYKATNTTRYVLWRCGTQMHRIQ